MDEPTKTLAAVYARYSTELQNESSVEDQIALARAYAEREGITVVKSYADRAKTGATIIGRDQLLDLIEDAKAGTFGIVIVESLDRLSRNQEELAYIYNRLEYAGVEIRTLNEGVATTLHVGLRGIVGQLFLRDLAQKVRRHHSSRVKEGKVMSAASYGYDYVPGRPGERTVNPQQAVVVVRLFTEYAQGRVPREIANGLNADGIPSPTGRLWSGPALKRMLENPIYLGEVQWNRRRYLRNPDTGKISRRRRPDQEHLVVHVPHLQIVDRSLWDAAQAMRRSRAVQKFGPSARAPGRKPGIRHVTLLSDKLVCEGCGGGMLLAAHTKTEGQRFMCVNAYRGIGCDRRRTFVRSRLERLVLTGLREVFANEQVLQVFVDEYSKGERERRERAQSDIARIRQRLTEIEAAMQRLVRALAKGTMPEDMIETELDGLERERVVLREQERLASEQGSVVSVHPKALASFRRHIETLIDDIGKGAVNLESAQVIRSLIEKVVVHLTEKRAPYKIDLYGPLVRVLGFNPDTPRRTVSEIAAEGGAGFFDSESCETSRVTLSKKVIYLGTYGERWAA